MDMIIALLNYPQSEISLNKRITIYCCKVKYNSYLGHR